MPCGGIEPQFQTLEEFQTAQKKNPSLYICSWCDQGGASHFYHEWDVWVHPDCGYRWMLQDETEGTGHGHTAVLNFKFPVSYQRQMTVKRKKRKLTPGPQSADRENVASF